MKSEMLLSIKYQEIQFFLGSDKPIMLFFLLINVKMPTIVGILTFMSRKNFMLSRVEHEKFYNLGALPGAPDQSSLSLRCNHTPLRNYDLNNIKKHQINMNMKEINS